MHQAILKDVPRGRKLWPQLKMINMVFEYYIL